MTDKMTQLEVCVCTYQRPQLHDTLQSLFCQVIPEGYAVSILVIDNDAVPSAEKLVQDIAKTAPIPLRYAHVPKGNISVARNGALSQSRAELLAFIDDDEVASKTWLMHLTRTLEDEAADVVAGPVHAVYAKSAPAWMQAQSIHSTAPVQTKRGIETAYTCNVLINRKSPHVRGLTFDLSLGKSGGEDTAYFYNVFGRGGHIAYAPDALVYEDVPDHRARFSWLARRRFRMGQTHANLRTRGQGLRAALTQIALSLAKIIYCCVGAFLAFFAPAKRNQALLRGLLHIGALAGTLGVKPLNLYGAADIPHSEHPLEVMDLK